MSWTLPAARVRPTNLGVKDGQLAPLPNKPNCVCSQAASSAQHIEPIQYSGSAHEAMVRLKALLERKGKVHVVTSSKAYIHAEFRAMIFFDDVEFYAPPGQQLIHVRSASRLGHSDLGANRRRIEAIRSAFSSPQ